MKKIKLYIDFDGVILDTISISYRMLSDLHGTKLNNRIVRKFYRQLDWEEMLKIAPEINNSIATINAIAETSFYDEEILTHINSINEGKTKKMYGQRELPKTKMILVPKSIDKCDIVDPTDAILVDDYIANLDLWYQKGGVPIKFSDSFKESKYFTITSLEELLTRYDEIKEIVKNPKKRIKR